MTIIKKLSIVIPAYNEERTIHLILDKVKAVSLVEKIEKEVIIVNDCSKDDTEGAIKRYMDQNPDMPIVYKKHEVNMGKGAALHTGIMLATGEYTIIQDADLIDPDLRNAGNLCRHLGLKAKALFLQFEALYGFAAE